MVESVIIISIIAPHTCCVTTCLQVHVTNSHENKLNITLVRQKPDKDSATTTVSVLELKTCANMENTSYSDHLKINRKISRGNFQVSRFMQSRNFFTDLLFISRACVSMSLQRHG